MEDRRNIYTCGSCGKHIVTLDRDEGVTPMFLRCRATQGCQGRMVSAMYPKDLALEYKPTFEWYTPSKLQRIFMSPGMRQHVELGGLDIRPISKQTYDQWWVHMLGILVKEMYAEHQDEW